MKIKTREKLHDFITGACVFCWVNWIIFGFVTSLVAGGYQPNSVLSQPEKGIYIVSKRAKNTIVSARRYKLQSLYGIATWTLWWASWPLLLASHLVGKRLDKEAQPKSRKDFLEELEKEEF